MGIVPVARFAAWLAGVPYVTMTSTLRRTRSAARPGSRSYLPSAHRDSIFDVLTFDIAQLAQSFPEGREQDGQVAGIATRVRRGGRRQKTYSGDLPCLLRLRGERRRERTGQRGQHEAAAVHAVTLHRTPSRRQGLQGFAARSGGIPCALPTRRARLRSGDDSAG